jgi:CDP-diacylglycerol--serine O-phosphatidyltransferase
LKKANQLVQNKPKSIYVLPNLFTTGNLFCGFYAIIATINSKFEIAAIAILIANIFDIADGKVARITNTTSKFGVEYDSLSDLISFGIAPSLLIYCWALKPFGKFGWVASFLFTACGALRLARFNVMVSVSEKGRFTGLPIPGAASMIATTVLLMFDIGKSVIDRNLIILLEVYVLSFLMVSNVKYISFKEAGFITQKPLKFLFFVILMLLIVVMEPKISLCVLMGIYTVSGPLEAFFNKIFRRKKYAGNSKDI